MKEAKDRKTQDTFHVIHAPVETARVSPLVFDNPHSCTYLPTDFRYDCDREALERFGDLHIEKILADLPEEAGVPVLESRVSRAYIDLNRYSYEIDPDTLKDGWSKPYIITPYTASGHGVFAVRLGRPQGLTPVFNKESAPTEAEITKRLQEVHTPYYESLYELLNKARTNNGMAAHINMHSYQRRSGSDLADIVIGDHHGLTCASDILQFAENFFTKAGLSVAFNKPFGGATLIKETGKPHHGFHSLQIEIARDLYYKGGTTEFCPVKGPALRNLMTDFSKALDDHIQDMAARFSAKPSPKTALKL